MVATTSAESRADHSTNFGMVTGKGTGVVRSKCQLEAGSPPRLVPVKERETTGSDG